MHSPLPRATRLIEQGIDQGLHHGVQIYVSKNLQPVADLAIGWNEPSQALTSEMLMLWMSSGKPITAVAAMKLVESGELDLDGPVSAVIPEFGQAGKKAVTLRHVLTHTVGLRPIVSGWPHRAWKHIVQAICQAPLQQGWEPGKLAGYDPARTWFILGELLARLDGRPIEQIIRSDVFEPLKMMDSWMAIPPHLHRAYGNRIGIMYGLKDKRLKPTRSHEEEVCSQPSPGGSLRGPVRQLGLFYEMMLRKGATTDGRQFLKESTVDQITRRQREGLLDQTFHHVVDFGLGLIINSNRYGPESVPYGFGRYSSDAAFGHGGAQSSVGFADPAHEVVVVAVANGSPGEQAHNARFRELLSSIYEDLGLAG